MENLGGKMMVTITGFEIELETLGHNTKDIQMLHGNKHLTLDQIREMMEKGMPKNFNANNKAFQKIKFWKINLFDLYKHKSYDAIVSYQDLIDFYEAEIFEFFETHPNMTKPNLLIMLHDYINNLYVFRS